MGLTSFGTQRTPARPIQITFGALVGLASSDQEVTLIGHVGPTGGTAAAYSRVKMTNVADPVAAKAEAEGYWGIGSELSKMVLAAINANLESEEGATVFPNLYGVALANADTDFGAADAALTTVKRWKAEYVASPYDGMSAANLAKLKGAILAMNGGQRVDNQQFGSFGVVANRNTANPGSLTLFDTDTLIGIWLRDGGSPGYSLGELAAAASARMAANLAPFNPMDDVSIGGLAAPANQADWETVGAGLESEAALQLGWTPVYVAADLSLRFVRTITSKFSPDGTGSPEVTAYFDVQDDNVLYYWRKAQWTRFKQPDWKQRKASLRTADDYLAELIRLAEGFQTGTMFQSVDQLAKLFLVERNASDRSRFDSFTPVNVIPGLHELANNTQAGILFDAISLGG